MLITEWSHVKEDELISVSCDLKKLLELPSLIFIEGPVGAGKTTLTKTFNQDANILSPTYSVINDLGDMIHADFYRLKSNEELIPLELDLYCQNKCYIFIEWGIQYKNEIISILDDDKLNCYHLEISIEDENHRGIKLLKLP